MTKGVNAETGRGCRFKDRAGQRSGRLVFIRTVGKNRHKHSIWEARCDCGNLTRTTSPHQTLSCGCLHKETISAIQRAKALPVEEQRRRYKANAARQRELRKACPQKSMQARISRLHRFALARVGTVKRSPTLEALGYSAAELTAHIEKQFIPGMSWENMDEWQIDHIIPTSEAECEDDVVALNQLSNLRPLWAKANNQKNNKREFLI